METIVPPVTTPGLTPGTDNGGVGGSLDVSGSGLEGLKPGISVNVSVQGGLDGLAASLKLNVNNRLFQIPVKLNLTANTQTLRLPENRPYPAEIKITASRPESLSFKFVTIDGQPPEKFVQTLRLPQRMPAAEKMPLINHTGSELKPEVQLHNLNFKSIAENLSALAGDKLSPETVAKLQGGEVSAGFRRVSAAPQLPAPEIREVLQNLKTALQQGDFKTFAAEISKLSGRPLPAATVVRPEIGLTSFKTPLGEFVSATPLRLDNQLPVELVIKTVTLPPAFQDGKIETADPLAASARLIEDLAAMPSLPKTPGNAVSVPVTKLLDLLKPLNLPSETMAAVVAKLPAGDARMLANLVNYVKASVHGDIRQWLGPELVEQLSLSGPEGREALQQLTTVFTASARETPLWRIVEIPFYTGENLEKIRLAVKKTEDEEEDAAERPNRRSGTRFVVDTNFTRLGRFQFDGYSLAREKRFDLIIRTERFVGNDLCANIMRIFKNTLHEVDYVGTIKVNVKENFIKIGEDMPEETLATGIFI